MSLFDLTIPQVEELEDFLGHGFSVLLNGERSAAHYKAEWFLRRRNQDPDLTVKAAQVEVGKLTLTELIEQLAAEPDESEESDDGDV